MPKSTITCLIAKGAILAAALAPCLSAQTTYATVTGVVKDATGAVIPGAKVVAKAIETNIETAVQSNDSGIYTIPQLKEGQYTVRVLASGFKEFVARDIALAARDTRRLDVELQVGSVDTQVEVSAGATLVETETARISDVKTAVALKRLPLGTRSLWPFLALSSNVVSYPGKSVRSFSGSRNNQSDASIDGITMSNRENGSQTSTLVDFVESFQETRVDMANNTAEFGSLGQVEIISKSGTNQLHGSAFDYYSSTGFRARNPFALQKGSSVNHKPGFSVGGPIFIPKILNGRNKSFFFVSYETDRGSAVNQLLNPTVPLEAWRSGDFSALAPRTVVRDPFGNAPFPGNRIPAASINSVSKKLQDRFYPLPNFGSTTTLQSQNYRELKSRGYDPTSYFTTRIDHRFSDKAFVFGRLTRVHETNQSFQGNLPTIGQQNFQRPSHGLAFSYTHMLRTNLVNEFRWGLLHDNEPTHGPVMGNQLVKDLGLQGLGSNLPDISGIFNLSFSGIGLTGLTQAKWQDPRYRILTTQFQDQLSWFHGRHNLKLGIDITRASESEQSADNNLFGNASFSNRFTGFPYADFLLGIPTTVRRSFPPILIYRWRWSYEGFITDEFKVTPALTLNIGLRYELKPSWVDQNDRMAVFDVFTGRIVVPNGALKQVSPLMPNGYVEVVEAQNTAFSGRALMNTDRNNFAPRVGVAWRPWGNRTVFRTGFGIFYDVVSQRGAVGGVPFQILEPAYTNPANAPDVIFPRVWPVSAQAGPKSVSLPSARNPDLLIPYSLQYSFTIEHQHWNTGFRISYIGTSARKTEYSYNINQPKADGNLFINKARMFPKFAGIGYYTNGAGHQYHALTLSAQRHYRSGLHYQVSYTLARDIGDLDQGGSPEDAYNRIRERGPTQGIPTNRITGNLIYELPLGKGKRLFSGAGRAMDKVIGGWEISAITTVQSGQFLTPQWTGPDPTGTAYTTSSTPAQVTIRPNYLHNANLSASDRSVNRWFDPTAFAAPTPGYFGTAGRGVIIGPGTAVLHAGIAKQFNLRERARLRLEMSATNVLNHPNWGNPGTNISALAQAGVISSVVAQGSLDQSGARSMRSAVRLEW